MQNKWNHSLRFEAFWASHASYAYPDDKEHNPWYLDLGQSASQSPGIKTEKASNELPGDINSGGAGFIGGPNVVTVMGADFCVEGDSIISLCDIICWLKAARKTTRMNSAANILRREFQRSEFSIFRE